MVGSAVSAVGDAGLVRAGVGSVVSEPQPLFESIIRATRPKTNKEATDLASKAVLKCLERAL